MNFESLIKLCSIYKESTKVKEPEAPIWAPFGEYAWAPHREGVPEEPDNDLEKEVYKELKKHFGNYKNQKTGLSLMTANLLLTIIEAGWYKPVLHEPPNKTLYRGLYFKNKNELAKYLDIDPVEIEHLNFLEFPALKTMPLKNGYSTSWSAKKNITKDFSEKNKKGYAVTLIADTKDNPNRFLAGPGGLYNVYGISLYHLEKETVGLEPIKIKKVEWYKID